MSSELTPWQQQKKIKNAKPWHLLNNKNYVSLDEQEKRFSICKECPDLIKITKQCKRCGCFMNAKTRLKNASCPIKKW